MITSGFSRPCAWPTAHWVRMSWVRWFGQGSFHGPSISKSPIQHYFVYPYPFGPTCNAHGFAVESYQAIYACVSYILLSCRPSAIVWRVVAVIVDTIYLASFRTRSHVGDKVGASMPSVTHRDASSSVPMVPRVLGVRAPIDHGHPCSMLRGARLSVCGDPLAVKAATTLGMSVYQARTDHFGCGAADTHAHPHHFSIFTAVSSTESSEPSERSPCQLKLNLWERICAVSFCGYSSLSHAVSSSSGEGVVRGCRSLLTSGGLASYYPTLHEATI